MSSRESKSKAKTESKSKSKVKSESKKSNSVGPLYSFFECNGKYIVQFGSTSEHGILHDIEKRTSRLHYEYIKSKNPLL